MTRSGFLFQAWAGCWGLKCKEERRYGEADGCAGVCVLQGRDGLVPVCVWKLRSVWQPARWSREWCITVELRLLYRWTWHKGGEISGEVKSH